jgi:ribosomal protein S25
VSRARKVKPRQLSAETWASTKALALGQGIDIRQARELLRSLEAAGVVEHTDGDRANVSLWRLVETAADPR